MKRVVVLIVCLLCCLTALAVTQPKSVLFDTHSVVIDLAESNTYTVSGRVFPDDASQQLNWYSSNTKLFTVQGGVITALRIGTGELRANVPGITAIGDKCPVYIIDSRIPKKLFVTPSVGSLEPRAQARYTVSADTEKADASVIWKSSDARIAMIDENGVVTAIKPGSCRIMAVSKVDSSVVGKAELTVKYLPKPSKITVEPAVIDGNALEEYTLTASIEPAGATELIKFASSDDMIASVSPEGKVTLNAMGECDIMVYSEGYTDVRTLVHVTSFDSRAPERILAYPEVIKLEPSQSAVIEYVLFPQDAPRDVIYQSSNPNVCTVDENGHVLAVGEGSAMVRIMSAYTRAVYATTSVNVKYGRWVERLALPEGSVTLEKGETHTLTLWTKPENSSHAIVFVSSDEAVVSCAEGGVITAEGYGEADVMAYFHRSPSIFATVHVTVNDITCPLEFINLPEDRTVIKLGETLTPGVTLAPEGTVQGVAFASSREDIVGVDGGTLIALGTGFSDITVTSIYNPRLTYTFRLIVESDDLTLRIPLRRTDVSGISENLARIEDVRQSAFRVVDELFEQGIIDETEQKGRKRVITNAFDMYAFPWTVLEEQRYWSAENSENGAKNFQPGVIYYGLPYISGESDLHCFTVKNALAQQKYLPVEGEDYYLLNQNRYRFGTTYVGNDCSAFVSLAMFNSARYNGGMAKTATLYFDDRLRAVNDPDDLRPCDILVRHSSHVVMFLYWADEAHTQAMFIEQGGSEPAINTVSVNLYDLTYYTDNYYRIRRLRSFE